MKHFICSLIILLAPFVPAIKASAPGGDPIVGIYVHTHWPYNHPYAARTWTLQDWKGYLSGLKQLGYNTVLFWPLVETMPKELTPSDRAHLDKISQVIDFAQQNLKMRFYLVLCPNIIADDAVAIQATFEQRHFFHTDLRVDPKDKTAVSEMIGRRSELLRPLAHANGVVIIDSDPGGYPGSTNEDFVNLLVKHRNMLDTLRPGIELGYWMHAGWPAYSRYYSTGDFKRGTEQEFKEVLALLKERNPEPWFLANNLPAATALGLENRVVNFRYGQIEQEPQFPLTNFWSDKAYKAGADSATLGIVGNAQSHVLQLPNTFAFARGNQKQPLDKSDYEKFADRLVVGQGTLIAEAWQSLASKDSVRMRSLAAKLAALNPHGLHGGELHGLIFGDPARFVTDLSMQLNVAAAYNDLIVADKNGDDLKLSLTKFLNAVRPWQERTGYKNQWKWPDLKRILAKLDQPEIKAVLDPVYLATTPFGKLKESYFHKEKQTPLLIEAMASAIQRMEQAD